MNILHSSTSRRGFLYGAAAGSLLPAAAAAQQGRNRSALLYVGTYSSPQGPEGSKGHGKGIYLFEMNRQSGDLTQRQVFADTSNPAWLALDPAGKHLYSANETTKFGELNTGSVSAFSVDRQSGNLTLLNKVSSEGAGPAHLSVHPSGKFVLVANYAGGTVAVIPIDASGKLGTRTDVKHDEGALGPAQATSAPPGSFAISGHDHPHAHMIESDPSGRFVIACDLGLDRILIWKFDTDKGVLTPADPAFLSVPPGDGPRHFVFHPNGRWFYALQEESSTILVCDFDKERGRLTPKQTLSSLPKGYTGTNFTSEIRFSRDGRFVYAANRLHDSIAHFRVSSTGTLTFAGEASTRGDYPRSFTIDPTGNFLYSCNQRSDHIATFRINRETGDLTFTGQYTPVGTPAIVVFL